MNKEVNFELAKLLKKKGFEGDYSHFYTSPNSKMFGLDEHKREFPIKNISKKLYTIGEYVTLNIENVYPAPTISEVVMWIYEKHKLWINVTIGHDENKIWYDAYIERVELGYNYDPVNNYFDISGESPTSAYTAAIEYTLTNLI